MTTLITIPSCAALHLPTPTSAPLPLATGDLTLVLIPANPPTHPSPTVTLSVGTSAFPLLPNSPLQKVKAKDEHATYQFKPVPADGGMSVGTVRISMKDSKTQGEWEATEAFCTRFEAALKAHGVWEEKTLFVNDEFDTSGAPVKGWGETVAASVLGGATTLAEKIATFTESHLPDHPKPANPPGPRTSATIAGAREATAKLADTADYAANYVGQTIHNGAKAVGAQLPDSIAKKAQPVPHAEKTEIRKMAEEGWEQVTMAAQGIAGAAATVGKSLSENTHKAVEQNYGRQADLVANDAGQTGSNLGSTAASAFKATSVVVQGGNVATGAAASFQR